MNSAFKTERKVIMKTALTPIIALINRVYIGLTRPLITAASEPSSKYGHSGLLYFRTSKNGAALSYLPASSSSASQSACKDSCYMLEIFIATG